MKQRGTKLYKKPSELWQKTGMQTHKWFSNLLKLLENIPPQYRTTEVNFDDVKKLSQQPSLVATQQNLRESTVIYSCHQL